MSEGFSVAAWAVESGAAKPTTVTHLASRPSPSLAPKLASGCAIIFDLDGVIVDSMPLHELAWERYLAKIGIPSENVVERMHGRRNDEIFRDVLGAGPSDAEIFAHGAAKEKLFRDLVQEMSRERFHDFLVPGVAEFLEGTKGIPVALATNAERPNVDFVLDQAGLRSYFQVIVDGSEVARPKPAPDVYSKAARELGIHPRNCIVFEDSPVGVAAALSAGARVAGILTQKGHLDGVAISVADFRDPALYAWLAAQKPSEARDAQ